MKPKPLLGSRDRQARAKVAVKKEIPSPNPSPDGHPSQMPRPQVEIVKCISFQKFRYSGENRPGKKYQEKDFMELRLTNLNDKVVRIVIICTDAENRELIHPNGLVGKDCRDGIYDREYAITRNVQDIKIPYLRTERIKTKKHESDNIQTVLANRANHLPSPYKERCLSQCKDKYTSARKFDTTKVCLGVIVTIVSHQGSFNGSLHAISHVVRNASEKTTLGILKLSQSCVSASEGGLVDIFTTEFGPEIEDGKYFVYVTCDNERYGQWQSEAIAVGKNDILYKRIISYQVPPFQLAPDIASPVVAQLNLECPQSNQYCCYDIVYKPFQEIYQTETDSKRFHVKRPASSQGESKPSKRAKTEEAVLEFDRSNAIRVGLQNKLKARQETYGYANGQQDLVNGDIIVNQHGDVVLSPNVSSADEAGKLYMNLDGSEQNANHVSMVSCASSAFVKGRGHQSNTSSSDDHGGIEVVATGYSEEVPPDTTVLIYTTNGGGVTADTLSEAVRDNQVVLQEIPQSDHPSGISISSDSDAVVTHPSNQNRSSYHVHNTSDSARMYSSLHGSGSQTRVYDKASESTSPPVVPISVSNQNSMSPVRQIIMTSSGPGSSSTESIIRRLVVPSKGHKSSPWEVGGDDDDLASVLFPSKASQSASVEKESTVTSSLLETTTYLSPATSVNKTSSLLDGVSNLESKKNPSLRSFDIQDIDQLPTLDLDKMLKSSETPSLTSLETKVKAPTTTEDGK